MERLLHARTTFESLMAAQGEDQSMETEYQADSLLLFATAAFDSLACFLGFEENPGDDKYLKRSFLDRDIGRSISHLQRYGSPPGAVEQAKLHDAVKLVYSLRNLVAHRSPSEARAYSVRDGITGLRNKYYDDPRKPPYRKNIDGRMRGAKGYDGHAQPLLPVPTALFPAKDRIAEEAAAPLAEVLDVVSGPMFLLFDRDQLYVDPIAMADSLTLMVGCVLREALAARYRRYGQDVGNRYELLSSHRTLLSQDGHDILAPLFFDAGSLLGWFPEPHRRLLF